MKDLVHDAFALAFFLPMRPRSGVPKETTSIEVELKGGYDTGLWAEALLGCEHRSWPIEGERQFGDALCRGGRTQYLYELLAEARLDRNIVSSPRARYRRHECKVIELICRQVDKTVPYF